MSGISLPWKMNEETKKRYYKYIRRLGSMLLIVGGTSLMLEHLFKFEGFDLLDFAGHEYYGLGMIIIGFLLSMKWHQWKTLNLKNIRNWIR